MTACSLMLAASFLATAPSAVPRDPPSRALRVSAVEGSVTWQIPSEPVARPAIINTVLSEGDTVDSGDTGRAELHLGTVAVRIAGKTHAVIETLSDTALVIDLQQGSVSATVNLLPVGQQIQIDAESAVLHVRTPGHYRVTLDSHAHRASILVREGTATLQLGPQSRDLHSNDSVGLSRIAAPAYADATARDAFDAWCDERNEHDADSKALHYVSRDVVGYADLDDHGSWISTEDGPAWSPADVSADWAPYTQGQWQWSDTYGWTWVDDASWGYAPSHYGRWGYYDGQWAWVPGSATVPAIYAPALVAFLDINAFADGLIATWAYATWFALAPHEPYIPGYNASPAYVQHLNHGAYLDVVPSVNRSQPNAVVSVRDKVMQAGQPVARARQTISAQASTLAPATGSFAPILPGTARLNSRTVGVAPSASFAPPTWAVARRERLVQTLQTAAAQPVFRSSAAPAAPHGRDYAAEHLTPPTPAAETRAMEPREATPERAAHTPERAAGAGEHEPDSLAAPRPTEPRASEHPAAPRVVPERPPVRATPRAEPTPRETPPRIFVPRRP